jgi:hypothetical protein
LGVFYADSITRRMSTSKKHTGYPKNTTAKQKRSLSSTASTFVYSIGNKHLDLEPGPEQKINLPIMLSL